MTIKIIYADFADQIQMRRILDCAKDHIEQALAHYVRKVPRSALTGKLILEYNRDLSEIQNLKDAL